MEVRPTASTLSVVGLSGIGKSTALKSILRLYPQAIRRQQYRGRELVQVQIPWLKIECPFDGSLTGLCHAFFRAMDRAIEDARYANATVQYVGSSRLFTRLNRSRARIASAC